MHKIFIINALILFGTISVLIHNYSVFHKINVMEDDLNFIVNDIEEQREKIKHYKEYERAIKISGFEHKELVDWLTKYGNGEWAKKVKDINTELLEENLLAGCVSFSGLRMLQKKEYKKLEDFLIKYSKYVYHDNLYNSKRNRLFKSRVEEYFKDKKIEL